MNPRPGTPRPVAPQPGEVMKIQEVNYRYGLGELVLRVTGVGEVVQLSDGDWLTVIGIQVAWDGSDLAEREILVRLSSLVKPRGRP